MVRVVVCIVAGSVVSAPVNKQLPPVAPKKGGGLLREHVKPGETKAFNYKHLKEGPKREVFLDRVRIGGDEVGTQEQAGKHGVNLYGRGVVMKYRSVGKGSKRHLKVTVTNTSNKTRKVGTRWHYVRPGAATKPPPKPPVERDPTPEQDVDPDPYDYGNPPPADYAPTTYARSARRKRK